MLHPGLKNRLKVIRCLSGLPCILSLLLFLPAPSGANTPIGIRITHPRNGFYINRYNYADYLISGTADAGRAVAIFANGILMETAPTDIQGRFSAKIDFSNQIEGPLTLLALQDGLRSVPLTGTFDRSPPRITATAIKAESIFLTFNESNLKNAALEENYRFSPSLNFKTLGGADDIEKTDDFCYRLSMKSIPQHEIITLALSGISDAAGNNIDASPLILNDSDGDRMTDIWETQNGLDPMTADALKDDDGDGFSNLQEYMARSQPLSALSAPIEIRDSIPQDDAGIVNFARVPAETGFAILIHAAQGIDALAPDAVRFTIDDGLLAPYVRDLNNDAVRTVMLNEDPDDRATLLWAVYDRSLEPFIPTTYPPGAVVHIKAEVRDVQNNTLPPHPFEFQVESLTQNSVSGQNLPLTADYYIDDPYSGDPYDAGIEIIDGPLAGAKLIFSSREPQTPAFGPSDGIEEVSPAGMRAAGQPLNLWPHTVFDLPVKLFVPVADDEDITAAGLAYHDGTQWLPAVDAEGNVLAGGEGWLVPGSRVNHTESHPALIEVQVYHFSAVQAVVGETGEQEEEEKPPHHDDSGTYVYISCFINTVAAEADAAWPVPVTLIGMVMIFVFLILRQG